MVPAFFMQNLLPETKTNLFYQANPEKQLADRGVIVPSGGVLGGGSSTNLMMYSRAQRSDFDSWGVKGWSADEMIPYMKKVGLIPTQTVLSCSRSRLNLCKYLPA